MLRPSDYASTPPGTVSNFVPQWVHLLRDNTFGDYRAKIPTKLRVIVYPLRVHLTECFDNMFGGRRAISEYN